MDNGPEEHGERSCFLVHELASPHILAACLVFLAAAGLVVSFFSIRWPFVASFDANRVHLQWRSSWKPRC